MPDAGSTTLTRPAAAAQRPHREFLSWLGRLLLLAGLGGGMTLALFAGHSPGGAELAAGLAGCTALAAGLLAMPATGDTLRDVAGWPVAAALVVVLLGAILSGRPSFAPALAAAVLAFVLIAARRAGDTSGGYSVMTAMLLTAAPLWFGPWAERFADVAWLVDGVLALSPLGFLAAMSDGDLLRGDWLYRHSAYGGLRYAYPQAPVATLAWTAFGLVLLHHGQRKATHPHDSSAKKENP